MMEEESDKSEGKSLNVAVENTNKIVSENEGESPSVVGNDSVKPVSIDDGEKTQSGVSYKSEKLVSGEDEKFSSAMNVFTILLGRLTSKSSKFEVTPKIPKSESKIKTSTKLPATEESAPKTLDIVDNRESTISNPSRSVNGFSDITNGKKVGSIRSIRLQIKICTKLDTLF